MTRWCRSTGCFRGVLNCRPMIDESRTRWPFRRARPTIEFEQSTSRIPVRRKCRCLVKIESRWGEKVCLRAGSVRHRTSWPSRPAGRAVGPYGAGKTTISYLKGPTLRRTRRGRADQLVVELRDATMASLSARSASVTQDAPCSTTRSGPTCVRQTGRDRSRTDRGAARRADQSLAESCPEAWTRWWVIAATGCQAL